jgi:hypothetical protein
VGDQPARRARRGAAARTVAETRAFGALTVRRVERPAAACATTSSRAGRTRASAARGAAAQRRLPLPAIASSARHRLQLRAPQIVEVDTRLRLALLAQPVPQATVVDRVPGRPLGRSLVVASGLSQRLDAGKRARERSTCAWSSTAPRRGSFTTATTTAWRMQPDRLRQALRAGQVAGGALRDHRRRRVRAATSPLAGGARE